MLRRQLFLNKIDDEFRINKVVAILGPRQCGKTTLARSYIDKESNFQKQNYFDLESALDFERLKNAEFMLSQLNGLVIIDEIQRIPELFTSLRVLVDRPNNNLRFLILGSASRELIKQSSESLAGRIGYLELTPFNYNEVGEIDNLWLRGGFPRSYLSRDDEDSNKWRQNYVRTFLEQDIPNLGIKIAPENLRRFWTMLAHYHGNIFNASELARSLGLSHNTIKNYLDILTGTFMVRQLQPWFENIKKRQIKSPKIYFRDSGILHTLLGIESRSSLLLHPKLGASWEGFALEEVIAHVENGLTSTYFWATHGDAELDLLVLQKGKRIGFEFKYSNKPKITPSMRISMQDLSLDLLKVIYPGEIRFMLDEKTEAVGLKDFLMTPF